MKEHELSKVESQRQSYVDFKKKTMAEQLQGQSKAQQKKTEKNLVQQWSNTNSTMGLSMSLDNAVMYM